MPPFRGSSRFESLILSHYSRFTRECNKEEINDGGGAGMLEKFLDRGAEGGANSGPSIWPQSPGNSGTAFDTFLADNEGGAGAQKVLPFFASSL